MEPLKLSAQESLDVERGEKEGLVHDVCSQATWSLSSCKEDHGIKQLLDTSYDTFWQSDGNQPHFVSIRFPKRMIVQDICIFVNYGQDESYTPNRIMIRAGSHFNDVEDVVQVELNEPVGWVVIPLHAADGKSPLRAFLLQLVVLSNHQNGRDTHIRRMKVHTPVNDPLMRDMGLNLLRTPEFMAEWSLR